MTVVARPSSNGRTKGGSLKGDGNPGQYQKRKCSFLSGEGTRWQVQKND